MGRDREGGRRLAAGLGIAAAVVFTSYRMWQGVTGSPLLWQDSAGYQHSQLWAGVRPPLAPLLWDLTGSSGRYTFVQSVVAVAAWMFLAWTVANLASRDWPRLLGGVIVLAFAAATPIVQWDRSVLSESLALSALALVFATAIRVAQRPSWARIAALVAAATALALVRDSLVWVTAGLGLAIVIYAVARAPRVQIVALGCLLVAVSALALTSQAVAGRNVDNVAHVLYVRIFPYPDRVAWFADHGMPDAARVNAYAQSVHPAVGEPKVVPITNDDQSVPRLVHWMRTDAARVYLLWLATHPAYVLTEPLRDPERAFNNADGSLSFYAPPGRFELSPFDAVLAPGITWVVLALAVALLLAVRRGMWRERWWQMVALLLALGAAEILVAWHGDGTETTRHGIEGSVCVRLAVLVLVVGGALAAPRHRSPTPDGGRVLTAPGYAPARQSPLRAGADQAGRI